MNMATNSVWNKMEASDVITLVDSNLCRLCALDNESGTPLFTPDDNGTILSDLVNTYLPLKVSDDGKSSKTICPGCTIQLEATVDFFKLIVEGQKLLRNVLQKEKNQPKDPLQAHNGLFSEDHPMALQMAGLDKPKRRRGRPRKTAKPEEDFDIEMIEVVEPPPPPTKPDPEEPIGKRRRKTPERFKEAVQGKELERIFREEGVIEGEDSDDEAKRTANAGGDLSGPVQEEVIGHLTGENGPDGEPVRIIKGKGRGRPRGALRSKKEECAVCGAEFSCLGRYMSHVAAHGRVRYRCDECGDTLPTRLEFDRHQAETGHAGRTVLPCEDEIKKDTEPSPPEPIAAPSRQEVTLSLKPDSDDKCSTYIINMFENLPQDGTTVQETDWSMKLFTDNKESVNIAKVENSAVIEEGATEEVNAKAKLKCPHCDKMFSSKQSKSIHIKAVHAGERPYVCKICGARFPYARSLMLHRVTHNNKHGYACDLCGKVLNHPSSVVYHKEAEHAGKRFKCIKCTKTFKHKQLLQRHWLVHSQARPFQCTLCHAAFKTKANLMNHTLLHSGIKKFVCEICEQAFAHKTSLTLHMRWHSGQKPFECKHCGKRFYQRGNLHEHERTHTGEKPYSCHLCPRAFTTSSQHRLHLRRHAGDKPYTCQHCGKRFARGEAWRAHVKREQGQLEHWCGVCGRGFPERWALVKHLRCHTGEKPFDCPHCPRSFADCSNLAKHKKTHALKPATSLLNKSLVSKSVLSSQPVESAESMGSMESEQADVIYVEYSVDDGSDTPRLVRLDPAQLAHLEGSKVLETTAELYDNDHLLETDTEPGTEALKEQDYVQDSDLDTNYSRHIMSVTDEDGNLLPLTMITSDGGKSYQVVTQEGVSIPIEIDESYKVQEGSETVVEISAETVSDAGCRTGGNATQLLSFDDSNIAQLFDIG